jgi:polygalacturonase
MCGETDHGPQDFLLTNRDWDFGNNAIHIQGGVWDGNKQGRTNFKDPDIFNMNACTGTCLNFRNVRDLKLTDLIVANSVVYFIRMCMLDDFEISNITFQSDIIENNQDGLHFNGWVKNGIVENIRALPKGQTNDDLIALNADDTMKRLENNGMACGPIEKITFRNIYAEDCHTAIRMLSVTSSIRNIRFENIVAGCRCFAINMDGARYCRTPLFDDQKFTEGVGCIENISIDGFTTWLTVDDGQKALIDCESKVKNFVISNFKRDLDKDKAPSVPTVIIDKTPGIRIKAIGMDNITVDRCSEDEPIRLKEAFTDLLLG